MFMYIQNNQVKSCFLIVKTTIFMYNICYKCCHPAVRNKRQKDGNKNNGKKIL